MNKSITLAGPPPMTIVQDDSGYHNSKLSHSSDRILKGQSYKDLSTICIIPTLGTVPTRVVQSWLNLQTPMNQKFARLFVDSMEVGDAYSKAIESILNDPSLVGWKYVLTMEHDNVPPPDGLLKLYESINSGPGYAAVGGLYWTKGEMGQPMIYGNPQGIMDFVPQPPKVDEIQECNGLGMGFTLFRLDVFKDDRVPKPWFKTVQNPSLIMTQDLYFFKNIRQQGYRVASDNRVKVGHWDQIREVMW